MQQVQYSARRHALSIESRRLDYANNPRASSDHLARSSRDRLAALDRECLTRLGTLGLERHYAALGRPSSVLAAFEGQAPLSTNGSFGGPIGEPAWTKSNDNPASIPNMENERY